MSVMAFDTLKTAKSLEAAGFTETAATKGDVDKLGSELRGEMATMEARLGGRIDKVEARLDSLEWLTRLSLGGIVSLMVGVVLIVLRLYGAA
jgi:hypothetical protein